MADIGVLYHAKKQARHLELILSCLTELSSRRGVSFLLFSMGRFDPKSKTAYGWLVSGGSVLQKMAPVPPLICNFASHIASDSIAKMRQLRVSTDHLVINPINRFHQLMLFDMLRALPGADEFLPPYREYSQSVSTEELTQTDLALIVQQKGLHRRSAALIKQGEERCLLQVGAMKQYVRPHNLLRRLQVTFGDSKRMILHLPQVLYLQEFMPLETRAYLQKNEDGKWQVAQVVAKRELFNRQQEDPSGSPLLETLAGIAPDVAEKCEAKILHASLRAAEHLDFFLPNIGTLTFDFLIGHVGDPILVGVSGWEQGEILVAACGVEAWKTYVKRSVAYGLYLYAPKKEGGTI